MHDFCYLLLLYARDPSAAVSRGQADRYLARQAEVWLAFVPICENAGLED